MKENISQSRPLRILLTGGTGYIGSRWILAQECPQSIVLLARSAESVKELSVPETVTLEVRTGTLPDVDPADLLQQVDMVVHLAGYTPLSPDDHADSLYDRINRGWTKQLGEACVRRAVPMLFVSTGMVYTAQDGRLLQEDDVVSGVNRTSYAESKYQAEEALRRLGREGLRFSILRFGSVFGVAPVLNRHVAINAFMQQSVRHGHLDVWRSMPEQRRPYTAVADCSRAIEYILRHDIFSGDTYNIVSENMLGSILIQQIQDCVPGVTVSLVDHERMNAVSFGMDDTKIRALGFIPSGTILNGLRELRDMLQVSHI